MKLRAAVFAMLAALTATAHAQQLDKVTFASNWVAQAEHGGFYQALVDGTYSRHGLDVTLLPGGILSSLLGAKEVIVNSLHSQGIATLAPGLIAEARAPDGLIEAVSLPSAPGFVLGVQWHPEWHATTDPVSGDPVSLALFSAFARALDLPRTTMAKMVLTREK